MIWINQRTLCRSAEQCRTNLQQARHPIPRSEATSKSLPAVSGGRRISTRKPGRSSPACFASWPPSSTRPSHRPRRNSLPRARPQLVRAVQDQHEPGLIAAARERLEAAVARAEAKAPVATDLVLQLIDTLAHLGI